MTENEEEIEKDISPPQKPKRELLKVEREGIPLSADLAAPCLTLLDNLNSDSLSLGYTKLSMTGLNIGSIDIIDRYKTLRFISFSNNRIKDISPLSSPNLNNLITLDLSKNRISNPSISFHAGLQYVNLSENRIKEIPDDAFPHPFLTYLNLNGNKIDKINGINNEEIPLKYVELRANKLKSCDGLNKNIEELDLVFFLFLLFNSDIGGLFICPFLVRLNLSYNNISSLSQLKKGFFLFFLLNCIIIFFFSSFNPSPKEITQNKQMK
jgi:Leucine-rich repeat (LRR) protein